MNLELRQYEGQLLHTYLGRELERLVLVLSRTDQRDFRHALAADIDQLRAIHARLGEGLREEESLYQAEGMGM